MTTKRACVCGRVDCWRHQRRAWAQRSSAALTYTDPLYRHNREITLQGSPLCHWCKARPGVTADHVIPLAEGGNHSLENLVASCWPCNLKRGAALGARIAREKRRRRREER